MVNTRIYLTSKFNAKLIKKFVFTVKTKWKLFNKTEKKTGKRISKWEFELGMRDIYLFIWQFKLYQYECTWPICFLKICGLFLGNKICGLKLMLYGALKKERAWVHVNILPIFITSIIYMHSISMHSVDLHLVY